MFLPKRDNTRRCNFSWELRLLYPQELFSVISGVINTLINSRKMVKGNPRSSNGNPLKPVQLLEEPKGHPPIGHIPVSSSEIPVKL